MILFYAKNEVKNDDGSVKMQAGHIFATIDGRVHDEKQLTNYVDNGIGAENIGKHIIGWIEKGDKKMEYNMDEFELLQRFEDVSDETPLDYKVIDGKLHNTQN